MASVQDVVAHYLERKPNASNEEVAAAVRRAVPGSSTTAQSVSSIKSRLKIARPLSLDDAAMPWVGEVENDDKETIEEATRRISVRYGALERMTIRLARAEMPSLIISGPPGLGKSYTMNAALDATEEDPEFAERRVEWIGGSISAVGLYKALWDCHDGGLIVLDDCDDVFRDEVSLNLLKIALDSGPRRRVSWRKEAPWMGEEIPNSFDFSGNVVFITNIDFEAAIDTGRRDAEHFKALIDRSMYLCLTLRTRRDFMIRIRAVAAGEDGMLVRHFGLNVEQAETALEYVDDNKERFYNLSLRLCGQIAICMKADPEGWQDDVEATKMRTLAL